MNDKPNILLITTDQQRFDALGCYGNAHIKTPNLDRLAREGTRFETVYTPSPVCAPARGCMMTGRYPHAHRLQTNGSTLHSEEVVFSKLLAEAGYNCGLIGKMHLGPCEDGRTEERLDDGFRVYEWCHAPYHSSPDNAYLHWSSDMRPSCCVGSPVCRDCLRLVCPRSTT